MPVLMVMATEQIEGEHYMDTVLCLILKKFNHQIEHRDPLNVINGEIIRCVYSINGRCAGEELRALPEMATKIDHHHSTRGADCDVIIRTHYRKLLEYQRNVRDDSENGQRNDFICFGFVGGEDKEGRLRKSLSNHDGIWNCVTSIFW